MGDRVFCTLTVFGKIDAESWAEVEKVIKDELLPEESWSPGVFGICGVNYGIIPDLVEHVLTSNNLSFIWTNDQGMEFGQGYDLFDGETGRRSSWARDGNLITMSVSQAETAKTRKEARVWQDWLREPKSLEVTQ